MTQKLYDIDSHMQCFEATVLSCEKKGKKYEVVLDRSALFPEAGGQTADTGTLGEAKVIDVQERGEDLVHITDKPLEAGQKVEGQLDWEIRFRKMQNHTGEHIVSGIAHSLHGATNVGFHLSAEDVTLDFDIELTREQLNNIEYLANVCVSRNMEITAEYPSPERLAAMEYRSKLELTENVRIVTIGDCDVCACCAPHVRRTGEVGVIKLLDFARHKGGVRIHMQCGLDALEDYREKYTNIQAISARLSAKQHETAAAVERFMEELERQKKAYTLMSEKYIALRLSTLERKGKNLCAFDEDMDAIALRGLVNGMMTMTDGICGAFCARSEGGWNYVIGSTSVPLRAKAKEINSRLGGKGGGTDEMIQGSVTCSREMIEEYFAQDDM